MGKINFKIIKIMRKIFVSYNYISYLCDIIKTASHKQS